MDLSFVLKYSLIGFLSLIIFFILLKIYNYFYGIFKISPYNNEGYPDINPTYGGLIGFSLISLLMPPITIIVNCALALILVILILGETKILKKRIFDNE